MIDGSPQRPVRWSDHAIHNLSERHIAREEAERTLSHPDATAPGRLPSRTVYMRHYHDAFNDKPMLMLVAVEDTPTERVVLTVYPTSRPQRYLRGAT